MRYDVFLSHHQADKPMVEELAQKLQSAGLRVFLDRWCLIPGTPWQEGLEEALQKSRTCAVLLGSKGIGPWENEEMRVALSRRVLNKEFRVIPVLLPGTEMPERRKMPYFLSNLVWVDFRCGIDDRTSLQLLLGGVKGNSPATSNDEQETDRGVCPFKGLEAFGIHDKKFFYGREAASQSLAETLDNNRFVAIIGPSGCGKSSLVYAGLIPKLRSKNPDVVAITMRPDRQPLMELAHALSPHLHHGADSASRRLRLRDELLEDSRILSGELRILAEKNETNSEILIFIDQFEELFVLADSSKERESFLGNIFEAVNSRSINAKVVIAMRADFYARALDYPELAHHLNACQLPLSQMNERDLRDAIEIPAQLLGLRYEGGLVETIVKDTLGQPGAMPLMQYALKALWEIRRGNELSFEAYYQIGRVEGALVNWAESIYNSFSYDEKNIAGRVFLELVQLGEGTKDCRRRVYLGDLNIDSTTSTVIETLAQARLLVLSNESKGRGTAIDLAHEALLYNWPRFIDWVDGARENLRMRRRLESHTKEWLRLGRDRGCLLRGAQLREIELWGKDNATDINYVEKEFLDESVDYREAERSAIGVPSESLPVGVDPHNLAQTGWGVIFPQRDADRLKEYIKPLLEARKAQAGKLFKLFTHSPGESADIFLAKNNVAPGSIKPEHVPYYLLIVGDPREIPFDFQYHLNVNHATGRIYFDEPRDYERYVKNVLISEKGKSKMLRQAAIFSVEGDPVMKMMARHMVAPIRRGLKHACDWDVRIWREQKATKKNLLKALVEDSPGLVVVSCHGRAVTPGHETQEVHQGALVMDKGDVLYASDVPQEINLCGQIVILTSSYSAGTPILDGFRHESDEIESGLCFIPQAIAKRPFIAQLPQVLMSCGTLAILGKVDRGWTLSVAWSGKDGDAITASGSLEDSLKRLISGERVGHAMRPLFRRYGDLATRLTTSLEREKMGIKLNSTRLGMLWAAVNDARNFIILGDPAVYLLGWSQRCSPNAPRPQP